jgi:uncharacterized protein (DUF1800 family)
VTDPLAPWTPTAADPFDLRKAGHLLRRAGFGGCLRRREELVRIGVDAAVGALFPDERTSPADELLQEAIAFADIERVRAYCVHRALRSERPLRERMSVYWHGHFATSDRKLQDPRAMALQMATFWRLGLGRFDDLCAAMGRDPALLRWLDNDVNRKGRPNENFARELFELFTLGRGHYAETDVREAARAFTGHGVRDGVFAFDPWAHDRGEKQVLGARGPFTGDDVVSLAVARPESARFLADRWLRAFVLPDPEPADVDSLARCYQDHDRDVGATMRTLLRSRLFFSARAYRSKVKSPADFVIGTVRLCDAVAAATPLARTMSRLGETWLEPPSVEGWHGERAWLNGATWLARSNFVAELLAQRRGKLRPDPAGALQRLGSPADKARMALLMLLDGEASAESRDRLLAFAASPAAHGSGGDAALLHAAAALPEYQLA